MGFAGQKGEAAAFTLKYEGGSAPLKQDKAVKAVLADNEIAFVQNGRKLSVPVESVSQISTATDVRRRFGAAALGIVPFVHLGEASDRYVGLTWTGATGAETGQMVVKLSAGEYRNFVAALERICGKKAIDTRKTPTAVHYEL